MKLRFVQLSLFILTQLAIVNLDCVCLERFHNRVPLSTVYMSLALDADDTPTAPANMFLINNFPSAWKTSDIVKGKR